MSGDDGDEMMGAMGIPVGKARWSTGLTIERGMISHGSRAAVVGTTRRSGPFRRLLAWSPST